ncbi:MAG: hypothetical protein V3U18_07900 [Alphaproteobacteria bacterium]
MIKLGGSMAVSAVLPAWLEVLSRSGGHPRVIVPGGGPFADQVRQVQKKRPFPDEAAHRMAVLAMEQYGLMLGALAPGFRPAATLDEIRAVQGQGHVPLWMAAKMTAGRGDIPGRWQVTSDSLAAWLAVEANAELLLLVKSAEPPDAGAGGSVPVADLQRAGLVDESLASFIRGRDFAVRCVGPRGHRAMADALEGGPPPGVPVSADG